MPSDGIQTWLRPWKLVAAGLAGFAGATGFAWAAGFVTALTVGFGTLIGAFATGATRVVSVDADPNPSTTGPVDRADEEPTTWPRAEPSPTGSSGATTAGAV